MSESMREEFEEFASDQYEWPQAIEKNADGEYKLMTTYQAWITWQASRASLCVELPPSLDMPDEDECGDYEEYEAMEAITCTANGMRHACLNAIHAAGVKTR